MKLLRNNEIKRIIGICIISCLIFLGVSFVFLEGWLNEINHRYIEQNTALVGAILEKNPELEEGIISIITKGDIQEYYNIGSEILNKYNYNESMESIKNPLLTGWYGKFKLIWIIMWISLFLMLITVIIKAISPLFCKISKLSKKTEDMLEGKFSDIDIEFEEGDFSVFYNKFTDMGIRLENSLNQLKEEKVNLKDIINDISHQLKTPLAALVTYNDILKNYEKMDSETVERFIELSSEQLDRMEWLITTLLKYARVESNVVEYNKNLESLEETINFSSNSLMIMAKDKKQNIIINCKSECIYNHDSKWIAEAISNVIKNAIEHTAEEGEIEILLNETALSITILIKDNGEGIEKSELKNIFKRFYKGQNSLNPTSIGIGLSLSKKIVEAHGGSISVESEVGKGTTFEITFLKAVI